jgi:hypothetical protein
MPFMETKGDVVVKVLRDEKEVAKAGEGRKGISTECECTDTNTPNWNVVSI